MGKKNERHMGKESNKQMDKACDIHRRGKTNGQIRQYDKDRIQQRKWQKHCFNRFKSMRALFIVEIMRLKCRRSSANSIH